MKRSRRALAAALLALAPGSASGCAWASAVNLPLPTLGGTQLWTDVAWADGWRVQRHAWTAHHRLLDPGDVRRAWGDESSCRRRLERETPGPERDEHLVVLLHGLGRTRRSLSALDRALEAQGFLTARLSYASTRGTLDEHAADVARVLDGLEGVERVSFVTHSLGGRVAQRLLERDDPWRSRMRVERVVAIAPPSGGARLAAWVEGLPLVGWGARAVFGPTLAELAVATRVPVPAGGDFGVIAGARGAPGGWNPLLAGDDDGVVALSETCLDGPHEHLVVHGLHTFLMKDADVIAATARFLAGGPLEPEDAGRAER